MMHFKQMIMSIGTSGAIALSALGLIGCGGDLTTEFIGNWSLTAGSGSVMCTTSNSAYTHDAGDITLVIGKLDDASLAITMGFYSKGMNAGFCDLTAKVTSSTAATLNAKACSLRGGSYNISQGTLVLSANRSLMFTHAATGIGNPPCTQMDTSTLAPK